MEYKERMLRELSGLVERRTKLEMYLKNTEPTNDLGKTKIELMEKQHRLMCEYEEILLSRIKLEMN